MGFIILRKDMFFVFHGNKIISSIFNYVYLFFNHIFLIFAIKSKNKKIDMAKILIIDDEAPIRRTLKEILGFEKYTVDQAEDGVIGLEKIKENKYDLVLCDIKMPMKDGIEVLQEAKAFSDVPFVMISGHGDIETAVDAIKKGAFDYISKPPDLNRLLITLRNAIDKTKLIKETKTLRKKVAKKYEMIGDSVEIEKIKEIIERVAPTNARVLITGENGTGKELVAHWLHQKSDKSHAPFIEVNCAAIPSELIESVLFGHEKGSFTSAHKQKKGEFELAHGGTIFLDEIGDMSLAAQAKVLRALQENKITRVGGEKEISVDVRVIAATNKDLSQEIKNGDFREDLYHRLSVIPIKVPALRERKNDIPILANYFMDDISQANGKTSLTFEDGVLDMLSEMPWTGNIRELRNVIERLSILCDGSISINDIKLYVKPLGS